MKIIIPMSGIGKRFVEAGYKDPKPLIVVEGKHIIEHIVNLFDKENDSLVCQHNLIESGVYCRKYYNPLLETTNAVNIYNKILCIPIHPDINKEDINKIVNICKMSF